MDRPRSPTKLQLLKIRGGSWQGFGRGSRVDWVVDIDTATVITCGTMDKTCWQIYVTRSSIFQIFTYVEADEMLLVLVYDWGWKHLSSTRWSETSSSIKYYRCLPRHCSNLQSKVATPSSNPQ